jgi:hypothetical protein
VPGPGRFGFDFTWTFSLFSNFADTVSLLLHSFFNFLIRGLRGALAIFKVIWDKVFKRGLLKILELYSKLRGALARVFGPLLRNLRRIRDWLDKVYYPRLLKIINMIQRVRQMLSILRIFNVAWAKRLDERLLRLETKIAEPYLRLRDAINTISTYLNLLVDPSLILRANPLIAGIIGALGQLVRGIFGIGFSGMVGDGKVLPPPKNAGIVTRADALAIARGVVTHDTGYGQVGDDARKLFLELWHEGAA